MLSAARAFKLSARSAPLLPKVPELAPLYGWGVAPRQGQLIMVAGRPGSYKTGFTLFWVRQMGLPTLYFSGDMTAFEMTVRLVGMEKCLPTEEIEAALDADQGAFDGVLDDVKINFNFGSPITFRALEAEFDAWMERRNSCPPVVVLDNVMDFEDAEVGYDVQSEVVQRLSELAHNTGSTVIVLHHATDKSSDPVGHPPPRSQIKNGLAEKPRLSLTVALEPELRELRVACVKQNGGRSDPGATNFIRLRAFPEITRFCPLGQHYKEFT